MERCRRRSSASRGGFVYPTLVPKSQLRSGVLLLRYIEGRRHAAGVVTRHIENVIGYDGVSGVNVGWAKTAVVVAAIDLVCDVVGVGDV